MKNKLYTFLLLSFLFSNYISGQLEFAPVGATWHYTETYFWSGNIGFVTFTSIGDTIIDNKPCRIINKDNWTCYSEDGNHYFHQKNDSIFYYHQVLETFTPIFIFNAEVGDSWTHQPNGSSALSDSLRCMVDSISFYSTSPNDSLRIQHVTIEDLTPGGGNSSYQTKLIENIGFELAFIPFTLATLCDADYDRDIRCYEDPNLGLITFSNVDCEFTPINEIDLQKIEVHPNPASGFLFINSKEIHISKIEIIDFQGKVISTQEGFFPKNQAFEIPINHLSSGIYFLKVENNAAANTFIIQKFVVQK